MNRDDIIRMAKEAEAWSLVDHDGIAALERFANLVVAAERERIIAANAPEIEKVNAYIKALAQPEPYAAQAAMVDQQTQGRMYVDPVTGDVGIGTVEWDASAPLVVHPHPAFQATPPQREWQGLTDDEVNNFAAGCHLGKSVQGAIYEAAAKLKEKNHGN